eukprot:gene30666-35680_t
MDARVWSSGCARARAMLLASVASRRAWGPEFTDNGSSQGTLGQAVRKPARFEPGAG